MISDIVIPIPELEFFVWLSITTGIFWLALFIRNIISHGDDSLTELDRAKSATTTMLILIFFWIVSMGTLVGFVLDG